MGQDRMGWVVAMRRWAERCADAPLHRGPALAVSTAPGGDLGCSESWCCTGEQHGLSQLRTCSTQRQSRASALRAFVPVARLRAPVRRYSRAAAGLGKQQAFQLPLDMRSYKSSQPRYQVFEVG